MDLIRIGDKMVSKAKIVRAIDKILELRADGLSQQAVADQLGIDRSFVSRLETMGEVRKGGKIALIGFPIKNKAELEEIARAEGVDLVLIMNDQERWGYVRDRSGADLLNELMAIISQARDCDAVIFLGSDMRLRLVEAILGQKMVGIQIGTSPITEDKFVDPDMIRQLIRDLKVSRGERK